MITEGMIQMTEKEKREQRARAEDAAFNRMLAWLIGAVIAEALVLVVKRVYIEAAMIGLGRLFVVFSYLGLVLIVLGAVWCVLSAKKNAALQVPVGCTVAVAFIWLMSVIVYRFSVTGVKIMTAVPIAAIVLILIYFLYHRAFFFNTLVTACGMLALWGARHFNDSKVIIVFVIGWVGLAALVAFTVYLKKNGGRIGKLQLVCDPNCYPACWLSCGVVFALTLLGVVLGAAFAFYLLFALVGWLFCLAVYYTVKLM